VEALRVDERAVGRVQLHAAARGCGEQCSVGSAARARKRQPAQRGERLARRRAHLCGGPVAGRRRELGGAMRQ
jgi:hypothetical protein